MKTQSERRRKTFSVPAGMTVKQIMQKFGSSFSLHSVGRGVLIHEQTGSLTVIR